ncbi:cypE [Symbiodinium sp. CCMP2592]|nr:cypE [Symbiodinium sp. CCMP2592]|mmetsp:Transcript_47319/g.112468  ORF Transcript_47319/g.112468 Transcript_47319/m.112468 type:complete len:188 (+) Transcript_47319:97-660(+)
MTARIETSMGSLRIRLHYTKTPLTSRNFLELAKSGYYDGCIVHRVVKGFMMQTGDPDPSTSNGSGGESIYGPTFQDEIVASLSHDRVGVVSMANAGFNTNSSQFFITFQASEHLDGKHTIFGQVEESDLATLREIEQVKVKGDRPSKPIKVFGIHVEEDPWAGQPLPPGAAIPDKPLVNEDKQCALQ